MKSKTVYFNHPIICENNDTLNRILAVPTVQPMLTFDIFKVALRGHVKSLVKQAIEDRESVAFLIKIFLPSKVYAVDESVDVDYLTDVIMSSDEVGSLLTVLSQNFHDVTPQMMQAAFEASQSNSVDVGNDDSIELLSQSQLKSYNDEISLRMWFELLVVFAND